MRGLRSLRGKVRKIKIFGFDIETCDNNKSFLCASIVGDGYQKMFFDKESFKKEVASNRLFRGSFLCATNLLFDFFGLFDIKEGFDKFKIIERGSNIIMAVAYVKYDVNDFNLYSPTHIRNEKKRLGKDVIKKYYKITFIDSGNHLKSSVDNLGKIINLPKLDKPEFLGLRPKNKKEWDILINYNLRDSEVTYKFMTWIQEKYNSYGANLKITIASTCMDLFRRKYLKGFWKQEERDNILFCYSGYYGGRTEAFQRGIFNVENYGKIKCYDVNSLYPYCLKKFNFPVPYTSHNVEKVSLDDVDGFEGVGEFTFKTPKDSYIPIVPVKAHKLIFPLGKFSGVYDFNTVRLALKNDYEVIDTGKGIVYENRFSPFKNYIDDMFSERAKLKLRNDSSEIIPKILSNGFYGKFAYNYSEKEILGNADDLIMAINDNSTIYPVGKTGLYRIVSGIDSKIPAYVFPIISLYVTSYARMIMFNYFKKIGIDRVLYTDTDSVFTTRKINTSADIGDLKLEKTFSELAIIKPKFYGGIYEDNKHMVKVKGVHSLSNYADFKKLVLSKDFSVSQTRFRKMRSCLYNSNHYVNEVFEMDKVMSLEDDKRVWEKEFFTATPQNSNPIIYNTP